MFNWRKCRLTLLTLGLELFSLSVHASPVCSNLTLPVSAEAEIRQIILPSLNLTNPNLVVDLVNHALGAVGGAFPLVTVGGTYDISATYCEPEDSSNADLDTVQLLSHGSTYTKRYWTGHGLTEDEAEKYSWAHFAAKEGYTTLSIDRIGVGESTHPDPLLEVQQSLSAEVIHEITKMLRDGKIGGKRFSRVIFVSHSLGSLTGNVATQRHPADFDALILTGWSADLLLNYPKVLASLLLPAPISDPKRFGHLNPLYLAFTLRAGARNLLYGPDGTFDPKIEARDWATRDTVSTGEVVTAFPGMVTSPFAGPVQILNGALDNTFCSPGGKCSEDPTGTPGNTEDLFPNTSNFTYHLIPRTGHNLNLHYSAPETYKAAHDFLRHNL